MIDGTVKFYNNEQRFGYIQAEGETREVRVTLSALMRAGLTSLTVGQKVKFDTDTDAESGKLTVNHIEVD